MTHVSKYIHLNHLVVLHNYRNQQQLSSTLFKTIHSCFNITFSWKQSDPSNTHSLYKHWAHFLKKTHFAFLKVRYDLFTLFQLHIQNNFAFKLNTSLCFSNASSNVFFCCHEQKTYKHCFTVNSNIILFLPPRQNDQILFHVKSFLVHICCIVFSVSGTKTFRSVCSVWSAASQSASAGAGKWTYDR